jgi:RNA polymerase sigma factor (TIGR02999 family)
MLGVMSGEEEPTPIGGMLERSRAGLSLADEVSPWLYDELRRLAARQLGRERPDHTLSPTALVHEAYLRLVGDAQLDWKERSHVLAAAAGAMRRVLVDHARRHGAAKRGRGWRRITLDETVAADRPEVEFLDLNNALEKLAKLDERGARIVELRFFAGLTLDETAEAIGVSRRTVASDWAMARSWLSRELSARAE